MRTEKEIEVIKHIIKLLNDCLEIHLETHDTEQAEIVLKNIQVCQQDLQNLIDARDAAKEPAKDGTV